MDARRHEVLARALGSALEQGRGLDLDVLLAVEIVADGLRHPVAHLQVLQHLRPAQVEIAVGETQVLVDLVPAGVRQRERRCVGHVVHRQRRRIHLDLTGREVLVDHVGGPDLDLAGDADDGLVLQMRRLLTQARVELHLGDALAVAQVDKDDAAVVTDGIDPADQRNGGAEVGGSELGAVVGTEHGKIGPDSTTPRPRGAQREFRSWAIATTGPRSVSHKKH